MIFSLINLISFGQCSFQYISNDTLFQDYIEFVYPRKSTDEIITIGSRINRGIIDDTTYNAPVFQSFDYCGNIINKTVYKYIGNSKLNHRSILTHNSYKDEPIGNTAIGINDDEFLIVDKGYDTLLKEFKMILFKINEKGELKEYKTLTLTDKESNLTFIKNVLGLKDGKVLVVMWDKYYQYHFYYFDENLNFLYKKSLGLVRGIRSLKEVDGGEFICTSLAFDSKSFQFYRFDTSGEIKWIINPYNDFGTAREIQIEKNKIYVVGGLGYGIFLICDLEGNILKEFKYDTFFCQQRLCSAYLNSDNSFIIGGYIEHCQSDDKRGTDVAIIKIDTNGSILWNKLYDFRNTLGTSGSLGYFTDYGGFTVAKANDGGIITNGMSRYNRSSPGGVLHEDGLLIKTENLKVSNTDNQNKISDLQFRLLGNLISNNLSFIGPVELIKIWVIYSLNGKEMIHGMNWSGPINIMNIEAGIYIIKIIDSYNNHYFLKFVKI